MYDFYFAAVELKLYAIIWPDLLFFYFRNMCNVWEKNVGHQKLQADVCVTLSIRGGKNLNQHCPFFSICHLHVWWLAGANQPVMKTSMFSLWFFYAYYDWHNFNEDQWVVHKRTHPVFTSRLLDFICLFWFIILRLTFCSCFISLSLVSHDVFVSEINDSMWQHQIIFLVSVTQQMLTFFHCLMFPLTQWFHISSVHP